MEPTYYRDNYSDRTSSISHAISSRRSEALRSESLSFRTVTPEDMPLIWSYLQREAGRTTDFSFGGFAMWVDYFNYQFCLMQDTLFIKGVLEDDRTVPAFSLPIGAMPVAQAIERIKCYCRSLDIPAEFSAIPEYALPYFDGAADISELTDWSDYLYDASALADLKGKKMAKKRNHVNKFHALYDGRWTLEPMTPANCDEAFAFMDIFDLEGDDTRQAADERALTREIISLFPVYRDYMIGALLKVDGKVCAFTIGDIKGDTLFIHIEKATRAIEGSYEAINTLFAQMVCASHPEIRYINREDDAGDPGLRRAKQSYHPVEMLRKYNIRY